MSSRIKPGPAVICFNLGRTDYCQVLDLQYDLVNAKKENIIEHDMVILTEHTPVFTLGKNGGLENLNCSASFLKSENIQIVPTTRGGNITFHGPGQIILYPIIDLFSMKIDIPSYVHMLEQVMILTCSEFNIDSKRNSKNPGIWLKQNKKKDGKTENYKIGSIGISLKQGISFHGLALNIDLDLTPFSWINPCGFNDIKITSFKDILKKSNEHNFQVNIKDVKKALLKNFESVFNLELKYKNQYLMPEIDLLKKRRPKPYWFKRNLPENKRFEKLRKILKKEKLNSVCEGANCPNKWECFCSGTATFLILGNQCTRNCRFCNIESGKILPPDPGEPLRVAKAVREMGIKYVVITSVTRDDLDDGGADHFAKTISMIRKLLKNNIKIEVLIPDFKGDTNALKLVLDMKVDVINHNIETVPSLYKKARPEADYRQSLELLSKVGELDRSIPVKSGIMTGLGETFMELSQTITDLFNAGCTILTIGQYLKPSKKHLPVKKYYTPEEFALLEKFARKTGFKEVAAGPFVRSSYKAEKLFTTS